VAALVGAGIVVGGVMLHLPLIVPAVVGGLVCFGLRVMAIRWGWQLPVAADDTGSPPPDEK